VLVRKRHSSLRYGPEDDHADKDELDEK